MPTSTLLKRARRIENPGLNIARGRVISNSVIPSNMRAKAKLAFMGNQFGKILFSTAISKAHPTNTMPPTNTEKIAAINTSRLTSALLVEVQFDDMCEFQLEKQYFSNCVGKFFTLGETSMKTLHPNTTELVLSADI
jgi:hypothetical protein